uniref:Uncharacterized protein n=1 Tax=Trichogramma kaykai TaxID=54128 RepID=A0ABD2X3A1_9HYME
MQIVFLLVALVVCTNATPAGDGTEFLEKRDKLIIDTQNGKQAEIEDEFNILVNTDNPKNELKDDPPIEPVTEPATEPVAKPSDEPLIPVRDSKEVVDKLNVLLMALQIYSVPPKIFAKLEDIPPMPAGYIDQVILDKLIEIGDAIASRLADSITIHPLRICDNKWILNKNSKLYIATTLKNKIVNEQAAKPNKNLTMPAVVVDQLLDKLNELLTAVQTDELTTQPAALFKEIQPILAGRIHHIVLNKLEEIVAAIQPDYSTLERTDKYLCNSERMLIKIYKMFIDIMIKNKLVDEHTPKPNDKLEDDPPIKPVTEPATEPATNPATEPTIESAAEPDDTPIHQTDEPKKMTVRLFTIMTLGIAWFVMVVTAFALLGFYLNRERF